MAKKIVLKKVMYKPLGSEETEFNYRKELIAYLQMPSDLRAGMSVDEMRKAIPLMDKLEEAKDEDIFIFEDSERDHVLSKLENVKMNRLIRPLVQLIDEIKEAKDFQLKESDKK